MTEVVPGALVALGPGEYAMPGICAAKVGFSRRDQDGAQGKERKKEERENKGEKQTL